MELPFPELRRVQDGGQLRLEPRCPEAADVLVHLRWWAAAVRVDTGVPFDVRPADYRVDGVKQTGRYDVIGPDSTAGPFTAHDAHLYLSGIAAGVTLGRKT